MTTSKARQYYVSQETHDTLIRIGDGNYSKGLRIAAMNHERLILVLQRMLEYAECNDPGSPHNVVARALLAKIEGESK